MAYKWVDETKLNAALTASADAIREKTGDTAQINFDMENETGFMTSINKIENGLLPEVADKDVNFFDFYGRTIYSYTLDEIQSLTELPPAPPIDGAAFVEWSWSLEELKQEHDLMEVGPIYRNKNDSIDIVIDATLLKKFSLCYKIGGSATVNWGDSTSTTITGSEGVWTNILAYADHEYSEYGIYTISISGNGMLYGPYSLNGDNISIINSPEHTVTDAYRKMVKRIVFPQNKKLYSAVGYSRFDVFLNNLNAEIISGGYVDNFYKNKIQKIACLPSSKENDLGALAGTNGNYCRDSSVHRVSLRKGPSAISGYGVYSPFSESAVEKIIVPSSINQIGGAMRNAKQLKFVQFNATGDVTLGNGNSATATFEGSSLLQKVIFRGNVLQVPPKAFYGCSSIGIIDMSQCTSVPELQNIDAFAGCPSTMRIMVPQELYSEWISATNWSTYASYIHYVGEEE